MLHLSNHTAKVRANKYPYVLPVHYQTQNKENKYKHQADIASSAFYKFRPSLSFAWLFSSISNRHAISSDLHVCTVAFYQELILFLYAYYLHDFLWVHPL